MLVVVEQALKEKAIKIPRIVCMKKRGDIRRERSQGENLTSLVSLQAT